MRRKHLLLPSLLASALLLSAGHALAGADLSVTGKIERAGACSLTLGNGGTVDLGTLSRKDLNETENTNFQYDLPLSIQCPEPTTVAIKVVNNRQDVVDPYGSPMFGLEPSGSKGWYQFYSLERFGDGKPLSHMVSIDGQSWYPPTGIGNDGYMIRPSWFSSWAEPGQALPQAFQNISSGLRFFIAIAPAQDLDLSQPITLDGSATMELVYL